MRFPLLLLSVVLAVSAAPSANQIQKIVGGEATTIDRYPYMAVMLQTRDFATYTQACGGTILNQRSILSAAHCYFWTTSAQHRFRVGSTYANDGGVVHNVAQIITHADYNIDNQDNGITIIRLATFITFNNYAQPGAVGSYNVADNQPVWALGWGVWEGGRPSEELRHVQLWTINQDICLERYNSLLLTDNMLCSGWLDVGGRDQCTQDAGGPLLDNGVVVGICSWGFFCGDPYYPGVNVRVSRYIDWIQANA